MPVIAPVKDRKDVEAVRAQNKLRLGFGEELAHARDVSLLASRIGTIFVYRFDGKRGLVSLSISTLAEIVGRSGRQVQTATAELRAKNWVRVKHNRRGFAEYRLVVDESRGVGGALLDLDQDAKFTSDLEHQDRKAASGLAGQDARKTSDLNGGFGLDGPQDRKFFAPRPEENLTHYSVRDTCLPPLSPQAVRERSAVGLAKEAGTPFADGSAAVAAVIKAAGLSEDEAAALRTFRYHIADGLFTTSTEPDYRLMRARFGPAVQRLGVRVAMR